MSETRQSRIARQTVEVKHRRSRLSTMELGLRYIPELRKDEYLIQTRQMENELRKLEEELHDLHVQQIREESSDTSR